MAYRFVIKSIEGDEVVDVIETKHAPGSSVYEKALAGLTRKVDDERFYIEEEED